MLSSYAGERSAGLIVSGEVVQRVVVRDALVRKTLAVRRARSGGMLRTESPPHGADARARFIAAILRLLETRDANLLTVDVIVRATRLSRTTFYRLFRDRDGALRAACDRLLADVLAGLPQLDEPLGDAEPERLRDFVAGLLDELSLRSRAWRDARWQRVVATDLERYIGRLREARLVRCDAPRTIATGVVYVLDGMLAHADPGARAIAADVAERLVFGA
jgi:AcrR family transcriptional regulator